MRIALVALAWFLGWGAAAPARASEYVGSQACAGCHTQTYDLWWNTRHGHSVLDRDEAKAAGYPLPEPPVAQSWSDISYVIGGRKRIAYIDRQGRVLASSYHHRAGKWTGFPQKKFSECGPCHYTGFGQGDAHLGDPAIPDRWVERNIGCESCHGPGEKHVKTLDKADIVVDPSSRSCGRCHTSVGRVLPKDDHHATHDMVQTWNHDPHVTGVQFHSHNAFCSSCHAPFRGYFTDPDEGSARRVFSDEKKNITCLSCHDPHNLSHAHYRRDRVFLGAPLPPKFQGYTGNDNDFTTTDYKSFDHVERSCVHCHRDADRIDLDHAHATCSDCHNAFQHNAGIESAIHHDANHRRLSCRQCHDDADHLISVLFRDPDFLGARNIHNLRTLPAEVVKRYGFRYPALRAKRIYVVDDDPANMLRYPPDFPAPVSSQSIQPAASDARTTSRRRVEELLARPAHARWAEDAQVHAAQSTLLSEPESLAAYWRLAATYDQRKDYAAAHEILTFIGSSQSPGVFRRMIFHAGGGARSTAGSDDTTADLDQFLARPGGDAAKIAGLTIEGLRALLERRHPAAIAAFEAARHIDARDESLNFFLALANIGARRYKKVVDELQPFLAANPQLVAPRVAVGTSQLQRRRLTPAIEALRAAVDQSADDPTANYFLGTAYLRTRENSMAAAALRKTLQYDPTFLVAWFRLGEAFRSGGHYGAAADALREVCRQQPRSFVARLELASLYTYLSDKVAFEHESKREKAPPHGVTASEWRRLLVDIERRSVEYGQMALAELQEARSLRPTHVEVLVHMSDVFRRMGKWDAAQQQLEWLIRRQPDHATHFYRLGTVLFRLGRYAEAEVPLRRSIALQPAAGDAYLALGLCQVRSQQLEASVETFRRGLIYEPFHPALHTNLGAAYGTLGKFASARASLERSLELATFPLPRTHLTHTNLALVHLRESRIDEARTELRRALRAFPEYPEARRIIDHIEKASREKSQTATPVEPFVFNEFLEIFGEVTSVFFENG